MEWEPKMPPWEVTELGREDDLGHQCSVDLKLGGSGDSKDLGRRSAESDSSKRPRTIAGGVNCLVDGCNSDLSNCREYHKRHKVCEVHSKTPVVMVKGQQQRFCQQCSRFHLLMEFDQVKRSCRKRLDGHNRRRRKAQPDASNAAQFFHRSRFASAFSSEMARTGRNYLVGSLPAEDEIQVLIGPGSACALSLLSSPSQYAGGDAVAAEEGIPTGQRLADSSLFSHSSLAFVHPAAVEEVDQTGGGASGGFHGPGFFHLGIDGPSARPSDAFPFSWQ